MAADSLRVEAPVGPAYYAPDRQGPGGWEVRHRDTGAVVALRETRRQAHKLAQHMSERAVLPHA